MDEPVLFGLENEYGFTPLGPDGAVLGRAWVARQLVEQVKKRTAWLPDASLQGIFLANGGRFYIERGPHPELSTPECTDPAEAVGHVRAAEQLLADAARDVERELEPGSQILLSACNMDYGRPSGETWGCHESYLYRRVSYRQMLSRLTPHLVSRIVYTGAGGFHNRRAALEFLISPRACQIRKDARTERRFANKPDEPLCEGYSRFHVTSGETLRCALGTWLKLGTTALIVRLIDEGLWGSERLTLQNPMRAILEIARDPSCQRRVRLADGRSLDAIEIQEHCLEAVARRLGQPCMPDWAAAVCERWEGTLRLLRGAPGSVATTLDWGIKHALFERWRSRPHAAHPAPPSLDLFPGSPAVEPDPDAVQAQLYELDIRFGELGSSGLFQKLRETGVVVESGDAMGTLEERPPSPTRARLRAQLVRELSGRARNFICDWEGVIDRKRREFADLKDPFETKLQWRPVEEGSREWIEGGLIHSLLYHGGRPQRSRPRVDEDRVPDGVSLHATLSAFVEKVTRIVWSPNGAFLACPSRDGRIFIYDFAAGAVARVLDGHSGEAISAAWSLDGRRLATGGYDRVARIWDVASGEQTQTLRGHGSEVGVAWSPDGETLATCSERGSVRLWRGRDRFELWRRLEVPACVHTAWSPNSQLLASASLGGGIAVWDIARQETMMRVDGHEEDALMVSWTPDGRLLGSAGKDATARIWEPERGAEIGRIDRHTADVLVVSFSGDGGLIATKGRDDTVRLTSTRTWEEAAVIPELSTTRGWGLGIAFHPTLPVLATLGREDTRVRLWNLSTMSRAEVGSR